MRRAGRVEIKPHVVHIDLIDSRAVEKFGIEVECALCAVDLRQLWLDVAWCRLVPGVASRRAGPGATL